MNQQGGELVRQQGPPPEVKIPALRLFALSRAVPPTTVQMDTIEYETIKIYAHEINILSDSVVAFQEYAYDADRGGVALFTRSVITNYIDITEVQIPKPSGLVS